MDFRRKVVPLMLASAFIGGTLISPIVSAAEVNKALAADPALAMAAIESMNLTPLSDEAAGKIRGEGLFLNMLTGALLGTATMKAIYGGEYCTSCGGSWSVVIPWFLKPITAS